VFILVRTCLWDPFVYSGKEVFTNGRKAREVEEARPRPTRDPFPTAWAGDLFGSLRRLPTECHSVIQLLIKFNEIVLDIISACDIIESGKEIA
jgi:hypothetical protein